MSSLYSCNNYDFCFIKIKYWLKCHVWYHNQLGQWHCVIASYHNELIDNTVVNYIVIAIIIFLSIYITASANRYRDINIDRHLQYNDITMIDNFIFYFL